MTKADNTTELILQNNNYWIFYRDKNLQLDQSAGKFISYIKAKNVTTEDERTIFFQYIIANLKKYYQKPFAGKIGKLVNSNNGCPILLYCNEKDKELLKNSIKLMKATLLNDYAQYIENNKAISWRWYWKSNQKTLEEIRNKTHWTYKKGIRKT